MDGVEGDGVEGEGMEGERLEGEGVEGEGEEGEGVEDKGVEDHGVEGEGVDGDGVELQVTGGEIKGVDQAEENDYSDERKAEFLTKVFNYLRRSQARPGQWKLYFHLDKFLDFLVSDEAAFTEVTNDTN